MYGIFMRWFEDEDILSKQKDTADAWDVEMVASWRVNRSGSRGELLGNCRTENVGSLWVRLCDESMALLWLGLESYWNEKNEVDRRSERNGILETLDQRRREVVVSGKSNRRGGHWGFKLRWLADGSGEVTGSEVQDLGSSDKILQMRARGWWSRSERHWTLRSSCCRCRCRCRWRIMSEVDAVDGGWV